MDGYHTLETAYNVLYTAYLCTLPRLLLLFSCVFDTELLFSSYGC